MSKRRLAALVLLAGAAALRFSGIAWDGWHHQHPDERFLVMVADRLALPHSLAEALDPARTPANPNNRGFSFYVYGALPPLVTRAVAVPLGLATYDGLLKVGRFLAILVDLAGLVLLMSLARRLSGVRAALLAGALYAACPLLVQQSRFATCDVWGTTFVLLAVWAVMGRSLRWRHLAVSGLAVGLAAACKPNLVAAGVVPLVCVLLATWQRRREGRPVLAWTLVACGLLGSTALLALKVADPGAFSALFSIWPNPRRLAALQQLAAILAGRGQYPPNLQWADRRAVFDPLANMLIWGTGPLLGGVLVVALGWILRRALEGETTWIPVLAWAVPVLAWHLGRFVCSVRHLEPLLPVALLASAVWLARRRRKWLTFATLAATAAWGLAWAAIAWRPYTRVEASRWLLAHLRTGAVVTSESWDDPLPLGGEGRGALRVEEMDVVAPDSAAKREEIVDQLTRADAVVLSSQRAVGSICRVPAAYPMTSEYYHLLFSGALGFRLAAHFERKLGFGRLAVSDLAAEETLSVYDHPPVWIFTKTAGFDPALARALLSRAALPADSRWETRVLEARGTPPYLSRPDGGRALPAGLDAGWLRQTGSALAWWLVVELAGLAGVRIVRRVAPALPDRGWGLSRWVGMATVGLVWLWLGWIGVPGWNGWLPTLAVLVALPWGVGAFRKAWREPEFRTVAVIVWLAFAFFLAVRLGNPEIYWGEKPMDAAILNAVWRAPSLPPVDPWFAGAPLNYYFFGFLPYAFVGRACMSGLGVVFNLAAATIPALAAGCATAAGWLLAGRWRAGALAAVLAQLTGTAAVLFHPSFLLRPSFGLFWASSRVVSGTINEYPVWTALFSDLHAHFMGFPGFLAGVVLISALAMRELRSTAGLAVIGAVLAVEAMTNTWELPLLGLLLVSAALWRAPRPRRWRRLVRRGGGIAWCATVAVLVALPFSLTVRPATAGLSVNRLLPPPLAGFIELFAIPAVLLLVAVAAAFLVRLAPPRAGWPWLLAACAAAMVWAPEFVTVADHMNTVFKFHLQAHLLAAVALAALLGLYLPALQRGARVILIGIAALAIATGLATALACTRAVLANRWVRGPRPTLDGCAYLSSFTPDRAAVLRRLARAVEPTAVAEPPGRPYSDTLRVPMFTGLPAVVGWPYHLWQRRHDMGEIGTRQADLAILLGGRNGPLLEALARRYDVRVACDWTGGVPALARLPGWRRVVANGTAAAFAAAGWGGP
jgi:uncharacterized membrane protein